jgi:hypothetical protein
MSHAPYANESLVLIHREAVLAHPLGVGGNDLDAIDQESGRVLHEEMTLTLGLVHQFPQELRSV